MSKEYRVLLSEMERNILIRVLAEKHNQMLACGEYPDIIDEMIVKLGKVAERKGFFR